MSVVFHDLNPEAFPFTVEYLDAEGRAVWSQVVEGPGALTLPAHYEVAPGGPFAVRLSFADGTVIDVPAPQPPPATGKRGEQRTPC